MTRDDLEAEIAVVIAKALKLAPSTREPTLRYRIAEVATERVLGIVDMWENPVEVGE